MKKKYHIIYDYVKEPLLYGSINLFQIGRLYCMPSAVVPEHAHRDWYELTIVTDGNGWVTTNGKSMAVSKGDIYLSFPSDFHKITSSNANPLKYDFFAFSSTNAEVDTIFKRIASENSSFDQRIITDPKIGSFVAFAIAEFYEQNTYKVKMLELLFEQIIILLIRACTVKVKQTFQNHPLSREELCYQIMYLIDTQLFSITNLSFLSDVLGYNYSYLSRIFKQTTGITISDYYQDRRLTAAKQLIEEGRVRFSGIAQMLNFSSQYAFSKAFKNRFGCSPQRYREGALTVSVP